MSTANRVIKNTAWLYAKMAITMFVSLYTTRLILSALGASDFGIYNIVGGTIALLGFINSSMASASQRFMSYAEGEGNKEKQKYIFNVSFVLHFAISIVAVIAFAIAGYFFFNGILNIPEDRQHAAIVVYGSMVISTAFTMMSVPYEAVMNAHENMRYFAIVGIFESLMKLAIAFVTVYTLMDKLIIYGILMTLVPIIVLSIMRVYCHRKYQECIIAPRKYFDCILMKQMTGFAGWGFVSSTAAMLTMQGMSILLNIFGGVVVNAAHGVANQLAGQLMVFSNNMLKALNPVLVKSRGAGDTAKMLEAAETGNKLSFVIYTFFAIPFVVECPFILSIWLDNVPGYAVLFVRLVLIRQMISQTSVALETCISATGQIKRFTIFSSLIWGSPIIIGYIAYKLGAPIYTIYVLLIIMVLFRLSNTLLFCKRLCGLDIKGYLLRTFSPCVIVGIICASILLLVQHFMQIGYVRLSIIILISSIIYPLLSYFFNFNSKEKTLIIQMIIAIKNKIIKHENKEFIP